MHDRTLGALNDSIAHWQRVVADPLNEPISSIACALCRRFLVGLDPRCNGCPVATRTGKRTCHGSPYHDFANARDAFKAGRMFRDEPVTLDRLKAYAQAELDFLTSLLPEGQS